MDCGRRLIDLFLIQPLRDLYRPPKGQIASLDFLRSCAILGVLAFHFSRSSYLPLGGSENFFSRLPLIAYGRVGVELFFVLSGYFIGKQLWREMRQSETINLTRFILRRGLRIWPLYYAVLAFVIIAKHGPLTPPPGGLWANLFFLSNYFPQFDVVSGSWSLSVEEQFYVATPVILLLGAACRVPLRWYRWGLLGLLGILPIVRLLVRWHLTGDLATPIPEELKMACFHKPFHVRADGLVMGLLLAHLEVVDGNRFKAGFLASGFPLLISIAVFLSCFHNLILADTGCALLFGSCTWFLIARRRTGLRVLESWVFYILSRLSFGMYLNHFYLLNSTADFTLHHVPGAGWASAFQQMAGTVLLILASAGVALVTFCLIEWPFLRLREWIFAGQHKPSPATITAAPTDAQLTTAGMA